MKWGREATRPKTEKEKLSSDGAPAPPPILRELPWIGAGKEIAR